MSKTVAIIPARGGSKRIPHKNIINFYEKPMIAWTIEAALKSIEADVYVSTDDDEIMDVSRRFGAKTIRRLSCNDDQSTVSQATMATLQQLRDQGQEYDYVLQLMANCPLRDRNDIQKSWFNFKCNNPESSKFQLSCFKYGWMNPWWAMRRDAKPLFPEALKARSQDLPELYCPTGAIWIAGVEALMESKTFYGPGYTICPIPWQHAVDIDDMEDLKMAEAIKTLEE